MMKVFVYTKKESKKVAVIVGVVSARAEDGFLFLLDKNGAEYTFSTHTYKVSLFQN